MADPSDPAPGIAMLRRRFLRGVAAGAASYLIDGAAPPALSVEGLALVRVDLDALWRAWQAGEAASIEQPAALGAERLARALREAPESASLYRQLAEATSAAAMLAGVVADDQGDHASAAAWHATSTEAARQARNADLYCLTLEDQAWAANFVGRGEVARGLLSRMPVKLAAPATVARVELGRASILAMAGRDKPAMTALDDAADAADQADGPRLLWRPVVTPARFAKFKGFCLVDLGRGEKAYPVLRACLREPGLTTRNEGILRVALARAAAQAGEVERACADASRALMLFEQIGSTGQAERVRRLRGRELAPFGSARCVRDLDAQLIEPGNGYRYYLSRTDRRAGERYRLHRNSCRYIRLREPGPDRRHCPEATGRTPAELAADPVIAERYDLCRKCLP